MVLNKFIQNVRMDQDKDGLNQIHSLKMSEWIKIKMVRIKFIHQKNLEWENKDAFNQIHLLQNVRMGK